MASSVIGALRVNLGIDTAIFNRGLQSAEGRLKKFGSDMRGLQGTLAGFAGAAGVGLLTKAFLDVSKSADEMGKMAQKFGIPVEELSGLAYAAQMADVDIGALAAGLKKLSGNMTEAASKAKSQAAAAFTAMGISVKNADGSLKSSSVVLGEVADKFATYRDGAAKTTLAVQLFGKAGADLIPLLNGGSEAIAAATTEARTFGLVISEQTARDADTFNDAIDKLAGLMRGVMTTAFAQMAGRLAVYAEDMVTAATKTDALAKAAEGLVWVIEKVARFVSSTITQLVNLAKVAGAISEQFSKFSFSNSSIDLGPIKEAFSDWNSDLEETDRRLDKIFNKPAPKAGGIEAAKEQVRQLNSAIKDTGAAAAEAEAVTDTWQADLVVGVSSTADVIRSRIGGAFEEAGRVIVKERKKIAAVKPPAPVLTDPAQLEAEARAAKKAADEIARAQEQLGDEMWQVYDATRTPAEAAANEIERLNYLFSKGMNFDVYTRAVKQVNEGLNETSQMAKDVAQSFESAFMSAFDSLMEGTFSLKDAIGGLLKDLGRLFAQQAATGLFGGGQGGGLFGGIIGSIFGGGGGMGGGLAPAMPMGNIGGAAAPVQVHVVAGELFDARVVGTAAQVVKRNNQSLPGSMADRQARGLR